MKALLALALSLSALVLSLFALTLSLDTGLEFVLVVNKGLLQSMLHTTQVITGAIQGFR